MAGSIQDVLERQQKSYLKIVDEKLKGLDKITFEISDMVRGKCVFFEIPDIIETVYRIKKFVQKNKRYKISEIENRFKPKDKDKTPISDVTLKIVIDDMIIAELQLALYVNASAYTFIHKIYQLKRTRVFSKIKIVNNYYKESKQDFGQLAIQALDRIVIDEAKDKTNEAKRKTICEYFQLDKVNQKPF